MPSGRYGRNSHAQSWVCERRTRFRISEPRTEVTRRQVPSHGMSDKSRSGLRCPRSSRPSPLRAGHSGGGEIETHHQTLTLRAHPLRGRAKVADAADGADPGAGQMGVVDHELAHRRVPFQSAAAIPLPLKSDNSVHSFGGVSEFEVGQTPPLAEREVGQKVPKSDNEVGQGLKTKSDNITRLSTPTSRPFRPCQPWRRPPPVPCGAPLSRVDPRPACARRH